MIRIAILVEGQTEEKFVKQLLVNEFMANGISIIPIILKTSRETSGNSYKGGYITFTKVKKELQNLLSNFDYISTMFDYYGLSHDFPRYQESKECNNVYEKAKMVEDALAEEISSIKFIPYIQMYEFEALLFSSIKGFKKHYGYRNAEIQAVINQYPNPEIINDSKETAPSKRIENIFGKNKFRKTSDGIIVAKELGLEIIRTKCKHFNEWLKKIEGVLQC